MRAPFQVLVLPYAVEDGDLVFALFRRNDDGYWQGIAGGGEADESPIDAARREAREEAGIPPRAEYTALDSRASVPVEHFAAAESWGPDTHVIPEYTFGVEVQRQDLPLSDEHVEQVWVPYEEARDLLKWDSNRTALWELRRRIARDR